MDALLLYGRVVHRFGTESTLLFHLLEPLLRFDVMAGSRISEVDFTSFRIR